MEFTDILKSLAPTVAGLIGTPAMGIAVSAMIDAFDGDEAKANAVLNGTVELSEGDLVKIKLAEIDAKSKADKLGLDMTTLLVASEVADKSSARGMQVEALKQDSWFAKNFVYLFATFWTVAVVVYIGFVTFGNIPEGNVRFADTILGFLLGTVIATIMNFFMGTSYSSRLKDESINKLVVK